MSKAFEVMQPTHNLGLMDKSTGDRGMLGVAWLQANGEVSIKLNPGVVLSYETMKLHDMTLRLFPRSTPNEGTSR